MAVAEARNRRSLAHYRGCLLGGAVGDAMGAPVDLSDPLHPATSPVGVAPEPSAMTRR